MPSSEQSPSPETNTKKNDTLTVKVNGRGQGNVGRRWTPAQRAKLSASMKRAHLAKVKAEGSWKSKDTKLSPDAVIGRRKQAAKLLQQGLTIAQVAQKLGVNTSTVYMYRTQMQGRVYRGKEPDTELTAARLRLPIHVYTLAKNLKKLVKTHIVAHDGDVDDLAMAAIALTRELLGE
jgi:hypothetical protein